MTCCGLPINLVRVCATPHLPSALRTNSPPFVPRCGGPGHRVEKRDPRAALAPLAPCGNGLAHHDPGTLWYRRGGAHGRCARFPLLTHTLSLTLSHFLSHSVAGCIPIAHNSGGPKLDIVVPWHGTDTGFLATTAEEFAAAIDRVCALSSAQRTRMRVAARESAVHRFGALGFEAGWRECMSDLLEI